MELLSISHQQENNYRAVFLHYYGEFEVTEEITTFEITKTDAGYRISNVGYHPASLK